MSLKSFSIKVHFTFSFPLSVRLSVGRVNEERETACKGSGWYLFVIMMFCSSVSRMISIIRRRHPAIRTSRATPKKTPTEVPCHNKGYTKTRSNEVEVADEDRRFMR